MKQIRSLLWPKKDERGSALVEMAFALPIMAIILLCIIDLGLIVREYQLLQNAAREGARLSSLSVNQIFFTTNPCGTLSTIKQHVIDYASAEGISINAGSITVNQVYPITGATGSRVTVNYVRPLIFRGVPYLPLGSVTLAANSVFQNFYGPTATTLPPGTACP